MIGLSKYKKNMQSLVVSETCMPVCVFSLSDVQWSIAVPKFRFIRERATECLFNMGNCFLVPGSSVTLHHRTVVHSPPRVVVGVEVARPVVVAPPVVSCGVVGHVAVPGPTVACGTVGPTVAVRPAVAVGPVAAVRRAVAVRPAVAVGPSSGRT